ncbi:TPA: DsbA family protein, partial [Escherichia coli]
VHHIWCPLFSQEFQDLPDGAETTLTKSMETLSTNLQLARLVGVQGTPATIIGDEMIPGAVSWETLEAVVKEKLAVAHAQ